ncbi:MAG TPA: hypothetical protein VEB21_11230, partial [Terriglobales bacterium]|nr:hypothetical protein [Terriglobales bacterium]
MSGANNPDRELSELLQQAKAKPRPVYLLIGDSSQTGPAARALIDLLVPESRRSFNLEMYEGRTVPIGAVVDTIRTPGFFAGAKVIWVKESTLFLSAEKKADVTKAMLTAWSEGREQEAAEKLLTIVALAGWDEQKLQAARWQEAAKTRLREVFGDALDEEDPARIDAIQAAAAARELRLAAYRDEAATLSERIEAGLPPNVVLIFTAATVDSRKRIVKTIREQGAVLDLTAERERSGALTKDGIDQLLARVLSAYGKRAEPAARELIVRRAGPEVGALASEVEKLCLFVGERPTIAEADVRAAMRDMAESWIFDLTAGLAARDANKVLPVLRGLFAQGEPPLRLLAMVSRELRLLLLARECLETSLRSKWSQGMRYDAFQTRVLGSI